MSGHFGQRDGQASWISEFHIRLHESLAKRRSKDTALICECDANIEAFLRERPRDIPMAFWDEKTKDAFLRDFVFPSEETFAVIYAGRMLEETARPAELLVALRKHLGLMGRVLLLVGNIQYGGVYEALMGGTWRHDGTNPVLGDDCVRFYTAPDTINLLSAVGFEKIIGFPLPEPIEPALRERLAKAGAQDILNDFSLLDTPFFLYEAERYDEMGVHLRGFYTEPVRRELSTLLHRVENDIDTAENAARLWALCQREGISFEYLQAFIWHAMVFPKRTLQNLAAQLTEGLPNE